jgi:peptidoglycan-associated lipoprotein
LKKRELLKEKIMRPTARWTAMACLILFGIVACGSNPEPEVEPVADEPPPAADPGPDPAELAEAAARSLCEQAAAAARQGDYARARQLYDQAMSEYAGTECARSAGVEVDRIDAIVALEERIHFAFDRAELSDESVTTLTRKAEVLRERDAVRLTIEGHCDERGSIEYNFALGMRRATAAKNYLMGLGISEDRLRTVSFGKERPLDPGHNEFAWSQNRRDEFVVENLGAL